MTYTDRYDITIIGGGIIGCATALALQKESDYSILIIEAEESLATHQTGNNSGVIHSGLYYEPGSLKAKNCTEGRELMYQYCEENDVPYEKCGKLVVAVSSEELVQLDRLYDRGVANGLVGLKKVKAEELNQYEPNVKGVEGLFVPQTGIVDFIKVVETFAEKIKANNGEIRLGCKFKSVQRRSNELIVSTNRGEVKTKLLVNCGGLYSDRIARKCGVDPGLLIVPFRGEYYKLKKENDYLVKNLIYPVPDPKFPFLGVHFTRMIKGGVEAGPNAVLAFKREGYAFSDISLKDLSQMFVYPGFWKMVSKYYKLGLEEFNRSLSKKAFVKALQKLIPAIDTNCVVNGGAGVRAQALEPSGKLVDDFRIVEADGMVQVLNAPSPAATASISIGNHIANLIRKKNEK